MSPDWTKTDEEHSLAGMARVDVSVDGALPLSVIFDALSHARSRRLLYRLADEPKRAVPVDDLAVAVAASESGDPDAPPAEAEVERVRTTFYHRHIPKLLDASLIRHDESARTVALAVAPEALEPYLSLSRRADES